MANDALLLLHLQRSIVAAFGEDTEYLARVRSAVEAARAAGMPVVHGIIGSRTGHPGANARNKFFQLLSMRDGGVGFAAGDEGAEIHPGTDPQSADAVVAGTRLSLFEGTDLDLLLRAYEVDSLVIAGIATSGAVLSTLRHAGDLDYRITLLVDGCVDPDPEVHRVLTEKVFPLQADVVSVNDWVASVK